MPQAGVRGREQGAAKTAAGQEHPGAPTPAPCPRGLAGTEPPLKHPIAGAELWVLDKAGERDCPEALPLAQHLLSSREELFHRRKIWTEITP